MTPHPDVESTSPLQTIEIAIGEIEQFTVGRTQSDYLSDSMLRSAVLWQLLRISETIRQLARDDPPVAAQITAFRQIIGLRTRLVHRFHTIDPVRIWQYIQDDLPRLRGDVEALLGGPDG